MHDRDAYALLVYRNESDDTVDASSLVEAITSLSGDDLEKLADANTKLIRTLINPAAEGYPAGWMHCRIHLNPATGEMHSDGDHRVRHWLRDRIGAYARECNEVYTQLKEPLLASNPKELQRKADMKLNIVKLIERVFAVAGYERAMTCARDCLLEWDRGGDEQLTAVMQAWEDYVSAKEANEACTDTCRHGAWVPAIPM
jgi:hypothetical protein